MHEVPVISPDFAAYVVRTMFSPMTQPDAATTRVAALCMAASAHHLRQAAKAKVLPDLDSHDGIELLESVNDSVLDLLWTWYIGYPGATQPTWDLSDATAEGLETLADALSSLRDDETRKNRTRDDQPSGGDPSATIASVAVTTDAPADAAGHAATTEQEVGIEQESGTAEDAADVVVGRAGDDAAQLVAKTAVIAMEQLGVDRLGNKPLIRCLNALEPEQIGLLSGGMLWERLSRCGVDASHIRGGKGSQRGYWLSDLRDVLGQDQQDDQAKFLDDVHAEFVTTGRRTLPVELVRTRWALQRPLAEHLTDDDFADVLRLHKITIRTSSIHQAAIAQRLRAES